MSDFKVKKIKSKDIVPMNITTAYDMDSNEKNAIAERLRNGEALDVKASVSYGVTQVVSDILDDDDVFGPLSFISAIACFLTIISSIICFCTGHITSGLVTGGIVATIATLWAIPIAIGAHRYNKNAVELTPVKHPQFMYADDNLDKVLEHFNRLSKTDALPGAVAQTPVAAIIDDIKRDIQALNMEYAANNFTVSGIEPRRVEEVSKSYHKMMDFDKKLTELETAYKRSLFVSTGNNENNMRELDEAIQSADDYLGNMKQLTDGKL